MIAIIDYGIGNIRSVENMFKKAGATDVRLTSDPQAVKDAQKILLPGVGHFDHGMAKLRQSPCFEALNIQVLEKKVPVLGICLGAQMLTNSSEEGTVNGLGWIDAKTRKFRPETFSTPLPVPHMGWSKISYGSHPLFENMPEDARFYFVHSYYMDPVNDENILCTADYGTTFAAGVVRDNIMGVQFHPEKSHKFGMHLLRNFINI